MSDPESVPGEPGRVQRVLLLFQDPLLRAVVAGLLNDEDDIEVVHACRVSEFEPSLLDTHHPDVVVADRMPAADLEGMLDEVARRLPGARLVSVNRDRDDVTVYRGHHSENAGGEDFVAAVRDPESVKQARTGAGEQSC
jgi:DNA-binding NarL/FixJ family response regulator